jgi:hypothetical protein
MTSYPTPAFTRPALAPGLLGAIVLMAGLALLDSDGYLYIRFGVSILALISGVFAYQAKQWWWWVLLIPIVIVWNPVWPLALHGRLWVAGQFVAALAFVACGVFIKVRNPEDRNRRRK